MGNLVALLSFLFIIVTAVSLRTICRSITILCDHSRDAWNRLCTQLLSRHLIVTHLIDALPASFHQSLDCRRLNEVSFQAETALRAFDPESPTRTKMEAISYSQDLFEHSLKHLTGQIKDDEAVCESKSVSACMAGLKATERKIHDAKSVYNAAVITYNSQLESPVALLLANWCCRNRDYHIVEFGWPGGDAERNPSP